MNKTGISYAEGLKHRISYLGVAHQINKHSTTAHNGNVLQTGVLQDDAGQEPGYQEK